MPLITKSVKFPNLVKTESHLMNYYFKPQFLVCGKPLFLQTLYLVHI